jgi:hypothetical protein
MITFEKDGAKANDESTTAAEGGEPRTHEEGHHCQETRAAEPLYTKARGRDLPTLG